MIDEQTLREYWDMLPIGKRAAYSYADLCGLWKTNERNVRKILHELSYFDNGDNYILIRSSNSPGFYRSDDRMEIEAYRRECLNRGRRTLAPLRKIDRVLAPDSTQMSMENNLKAVRVSLGLKAVDVCASMKLFDKSFDVATLSKMENSKCMPTPYQLAHLAAIYHCTPHELLDIDLYRASI